MRERETMNLMKLARMAKKAGIDIRQGYRGLQTAADLAIWLLNEHKAENFVRITMAFDPTSNDERFEGHTGVDLIAKWADGDDETRWLTKRLNETEAKLKTAMAVLSTTAARYEKGDEHDLILKEVAAFVDLNLNNEVCN